MVFVDTVECACMPAAGGFVLFAGFVVDDFAMSSIDNFNLIHITPRVGLVGGIVFVAYCYLTT